MSVINDATSSVEITVKLARERLDLVTSPFLTVYPMGSRPKGLFLLINNVQFEDSKYCSRHGAELDEVNLLSVFQQLGYSTVAFRDLSLKELTEKVKKFAKIANESKANSVAVSIMSHGIGGKKGTDIITRDGARVAIEDILEEFSARSCPNLAHKPKIFLIEANRGSRHNYPMEVVSRKLKSAEPQSSHDGYSSQFTSTIDNAFIAYSSLPGYVSMRNVTEGSWFIQKTCRVLAEHACDTSLDDMFFMVDNSMASLVSSDDDMQTCCLENRGFGKLFFGPGLYDENSAANTDILRAMIDQDSITAKVELLCRKRDTLLPCVVSLKLATERLDISTGSNKHVYPMGSRPKGLCLVINMTLNNLESKMHAGEKDQIQTLALFEQLGYICVNFMNLMHKEFVSTIKKYADFASESHFNSLVFCFIGHGKEGLRGTSVRTHDGTFISIEDIVDEFSSTNCPGMASRPKIFIFSLSRVFGEESTVVFDGPTDCMAEGQSVPSSDDVFLVQSLSPVQNTVRAAGVGSRFIDALCRVFMEYACDTSLEDMFRMVSRMVGEASYEKRNFQEFFFNPGLYDADL